MRTNSALRSHSSAPPLEAVRSPRDLRVADQILARLERRGIDRIFGIPGGTISPIFDALVDRGIELVTAQHEAMAVYMAMGHAIATGRPGVVAVTSGPGALNAVTGCAAAHLDGVPLLLLVGEPPVSRAGRSPIQEGSQAGLDLLNVFRSVTRHQEMLLHPQRAGALVDHALSVAEGSPPGPVVLLLPIDVTQRVEATAEIYCSPSPAAVAPPSVCRDIAGWLEAAHRPLLLLGRGSRARGVAPLVRELAEYLRCPVATDIEAKGVFPESHPLSLGVFGIGERGRVRAFLEEGVDLLITLGCRLDDTNTAGYSELLRPAGVLAQVDASPSRLARAYPSDIAVSCDIASFLRQVLDASAVPDPDGVVARDRALRRTADASPAVRAMRTAPHHPGSIPPELQRLWPDAVFTSDIGNHLIFASQGLVIDQSDGFHVGYGLGGMGSGIGCAIGLQIGYQGQRQVISICGDGGLLMVGSELATCARYEIPLILAVFNDGALGMVAHGMEATYDRPCAFPTPTVDLVRYAESLGCAAVRIEHIEMLERVARRRPKGPLLLDIPVDPNIRAMHTRSDACSFQKART